LSDRKLLRDNPVEWAGFHGRKIALFSQRRIGRQQIFIWWSQVVTFGWDSFVLVYWEPGGFTHSPEAAKIRDWKSFLSWHTFARQNPISGWLHVFKLSLFIADGTKLLFFPRSLSPHIKLNFVAKRCQAKLCVAVIFFARPKTLSWLCFVKSAGGKAHGWDLSFIMLPCRKVLVFFFALPSILYQHDTAWI
jgi:hypothetical protein